ncbi:MAG: hypothetical protein JWR04_1836 [Rhodoglobus sp.]|nr:hypothetical protein [Rhodoglobus sp.]
MSEAPPASRVSGDVRNHNLSLILAHLARVGPSARSEISDATGLTRGAVTALAQILTSAGLARELDSVSSGKGRPLTKLELAADGVALLAVQLASDDVTALLTTLSGEELYRRAVAHGRPMGDPEAVLDVLARVVEDVLGESKRLGRRVIDISVVALAPVGGEPTIVLADVSLGWLQVDVLAGLTARIPGIDGTPIRLGSDTPVAALAELELLKAGGDALYLKSDSNVGGAIISAGRNIEGAHGFGGSLGHVAIVPDGLPCECGQHGCLVTVAGVGPLLGDRGWAKQGPSVALEEFVTRVEAGDPEAVAAWEAAVPWIGRTLQVLAMATNPGVIVIGGHWARLRDSIERAFLSNRPFAPGGRDEFEPAVVAGVLGADAALRGAVWAARDRFIRDPSLLLKIQRLN